MKEGTSDGIILDINSKPNISMLTPPKFANDLVSGIKNSSKGRIIESDPTICRKGPEVLQGQRTPTGRLKLEWKENENKRAFLGKVVHFG